MASSSAARRRPAAESTVETCTHWSLRDLKEIRARALAFRSEEAIPRIREIAKDFNGACSSENPANTQSEPALRRLLFRANPAARVIYIDSSMIRFRAPSLSVLPRLPQGYGFKGGAARLALQAVLGQQIAARAPRDLDLVRFGRAPCRQDTVVAERFMGEDQRRGFGVELLSKLDDYLATRDITLNEVLLISGQVICSIQCLRDTLKGIIRPAAHAYGENGVQPLIAAKMLRLKAEAAARGLPFEIAGLQKPLHLGAFEIALHFSRVLTISPEAGAAYLRECVEWQAIPAHIEDAANLRRHLTELLPGSPILRALEPEASGIDQTRIPRRLAAG